MNEALSGRDAVGLRVRTQADLSKAIEIVFSGKEKQMVPHTLVGD